MDGRQSATDQNQSTHGCDCAWLGAKEAEPIAVRTKWKKWSGEATECWSSGEHLGARVISGLETGHAEGRVWLHVISVLFDLARGALRATAWLLTLARVGSFLETK